MKIHIELLKFEKWELVLPEETQEFVSTDVPIIQRWCIAFLVGNIRC
jgi:hypothetical protein